LVSGTNLAPGEIAGIVTAVILVVGGTIAVAVVVLAVKRKIPEEESGVNRDLL
jgi:hypothetical protein